jgi:hypothetical protein
MRIAVLLLAASCVLADDTVQGFEEKDQGTPFVLKQHKSEPGPKVESGQLLLLNGGRARGPLQNSIAFPCTEPGAWPIVEASFLISFTKGAHGGGFALLNTEHFGTKGEAPDHLAWEEPNFEGSLAVGFDTFNPPTTHWFDKWGNVDDKPQREISLHWDGRELAGWLSPVEFRDGKDHRFALKVRYAPGGAYVTMRLDDTAICDERFFCGPTPYEARAAFGGRTGDTTTYMTLNDVRVGFRKSPQGFPDPIRVKAIDDAVIFRQQSLFTKEVDLPEKSFERVVLTLSQGPAPGGWDDWDRAASVYVWRGEERIELLRWITPFRREYSWSVDVTDVQTLLKGKVKLGVWIGTMAGKAKQGEKQKGFSVDVDLDFYPGHAKPDPFAVVQLWSDHVHFQNDGERMKKMFPERSVPIPADAKGAKLRFVVTGHGQFGEFTAAKRLALFDGHEFENTLWKDDVYLNPCRPQSGTWKFHRAGWAPGDVVAPWEIDVTEWLEPGATAKIGYLPLPWDIPAGGKIQASHRVEGVMILYR